MRNTLPVLKNWLMDLKNMLIRKWEDICSHVISSVITAAIIAIIGIINVKYFFITLLALVFIVFVILKKSSNPSIEKEIGSVGIGAKQTIKENNQYFQLITSNNSKGRNNEVVILIESARQLLEMDYLNGSWGKTIGKYIDLTQYPPGWTPQAQYPPKWTDQEKFQYVISGSLTNTYHALNGLSSYYRISNNIFEPQRALSIIKFLRAWRHYGAFSTPVTNVNASIGDPSLKADGQELLRNQDPQLLRHTACGILSIRRMLELRDITENSPNSTGKVIHAWELIVQELRDFQIEALDAISSYHDFIKRKGDSIWGNLKFTPAYLILGINEGLREHQEDLKNEKGNDVIEKLNNIEKMLIDFLIKRALDPGERFLFQNKNKKSYYFFSLVVLECYLQVDKFIQDHRSYQFCSKLIQAFCDVVMRTSGLSFGNPDIPGMEWLNYLDVGVTCRFLYVLSLYCKAFHTWTPEIEKASIKALEFIIRSSSDISEANHNCITQGWESIIQLLKLCHPNALNNISAELNKLTDNNKTEINRIVRAISQRDFEGFNSSDLRAKLMEMLCRDYGFVSIYQMCERENSSKESDSRVLREALLKYYGLHTFQTFLNNNQIPYHQTNSVENMIDNTLRQFHYSK